MPLILKQTPVGKRLFLIEKELVEKMLTAGTAVPCPGYDLYEEVTDEEMSQGYMTRNMTPLKGKRRGRPPKARKEDQSMSGEEDEVVADVADAEVAEDAEVEAAEESAE